MNNNRLLIIVAILFVMPKEVSAQWKIGLTAGATYNHYSMDTHYMSDLHINDEWGFTYLSNNKGLYLGSFGILLQYDFNDWFGLRVDLNKTQKNYSYYRTTVSEKIYYFNNYLQVPMMAVFKFGGNSSFRGFVNIGAFGAYWMERNESGKYDFLLFSLTATTDKREYDNERDNRWEYGLNCGMGLEWHFSLFEKKWIWQILEARMYYSTSSTQKDYMRIKDPRYNTTLSLQSGLIYCF